jgi:hypothetical protein
MQVTDVLIVNDNLIAQAVRELGIRVPVLRVEAHGNGGLKLWLYGGQGEPVVWEPQAKAEVKAKAEAKVEVEAKVEAKVEAEAEPKPKRTSRSKPKAR